MKTYENLKNPLKSSEILLKLSDARKGSDTAAAAGDVREQKGKAKKKETPRQRLNLRYGDNSSSSRFTIRRFDEENEP